MTLSLYAASVPVFKQMLNSVSAILAKADQHAAAKNIEPNVLLQARLYPDMYPLIRQVQIATDFSRGVSARLAGVDVPQYDNKEQTFADLQAHLGKTLAFIEGFTPAQIDGNEEHEIIIYPGTPKEKKFTGQSYLLNYGLPHFFFHVTTTYAILRHNGVEVAKRNYMGTY